MTRPEPQRVGIGLAEIRTSPTDAWTLRDIAARLIRPWRHRDDRPRLYLPELKPGRWYLSYADRCTDTGTGARPGGFLVDDYACNIWVTPDIDRDRVLLPGYRISRWVQGDPSDFAPPPSGRHDH